MIDILRPRTLVVFAVIALSPLPALAVSPLLLSGHGSWVNDVAVHTELGVVATGGNDGVLGLWSLVDGSRRAFLPLQRRESPLGDDDLLHHLGVPVYSLDFNNDGRHLAAGCGDGCIHLIDVAARRFEASLPDASGHLNVVRWLPDGTLLAGTIDGRLVLWDVDHREKLADRRVFQFPIQGLALAPGADHAAVASNESRIRIVKLPSLEVTDVLSGHKDLLYCVAWSRDGRYLATGSNDRTVLLWDLQAGGHHTVLWTGERPIYAVAFHPDGKQVALAEQAQPIRLLAVPSGQSVAEFVGHTADVVALRFTDDGRLISGARDATARIWPVEVNR